MMGVAKYFILSIFYFALCATSDVNAASQQQLLQIPLQTNSGKIIRMDNISYLTFNENPMRPWFLQDMNKKVGGTALMDLLDYVGNPTRRGRHSAASIVMTKVPKTPMESWIWNNILFKDKGF